jgi:hypothetical protein
LRTATDPAFKTAPRQSSGNGYPVSCVWFPFEEAGMKIYFAVLAFVGVFVFLVLFIADRERRAGVERLSDFKFGPHSALEVGLFSKS